MNDPLSATALAAASKLQSEDRPGLRDQVEEILDAETRREVSQFRDDRPALASLIITIASLASNIYNDLKKSGSQADSEIVTRAVRIEMRELNQTASDDVIEAVVDAVLEIMPEGTGEEAATDIHENTESPQRPPQINEQLSDKFKTDFYPILEERLLSHPARNLFHRGRRSLADLPSVKLGSILVFRNGSQYVALQEGARLTGGEDFIVNATSVFLIDVRTRYLTVQLQSPSLHPADDFVISATFRSRVTDPVRVAVESSINISELLFGYLRRAPRLWSLTENRSPEEISEVRELVVSHIKAYAEIRPIQLPGMTVDFAWADVLLPRELRAHAQKVRNELHLQELERLRARREDVQIERYRHLIGQGQSSLIALALARGDASITEAIDRLRLDQTRHQEQLIEALHILQQSGELAYDDIDPADLVNAYIEKSRRQDSSTSASAESDRQENEQQALAIEVETSAERGGQDYTKTRNLQIDIQIFLEDSSAAFAVEQALRELLSELDVIEIAEMRTVYGSWYRSLVGFLNKASDSVTAAEARRALEIQLLDRYQAGIDGVTGDAVAKLIMSLGQTPGAVVQVGSVILVKVNETIVVRQLTGREMVHWQKNPALFKNPADALSELQRAVANSAHAQDSDPAGKRLRDEFS